MPKGYLLAQIEITDPERYARYASASSAVIAQYEGRWFVRPESALIVEGDPKPRTAIFEFDTFEQAKACWESDEYALTKHFRANAAECDFILLKGAG